MKKRYKGILAALAVGVLIFGTGLTGEAARTGTITTDGSRVRASADAEGQKVCSLPVDTIVDITDEAESGGKTWYQISFTLDGAQKTGWIRSDLLSVTETEETTESAEGEAEAEESTEGESETAEAVSAGAYTIQEPESDYENADSLDKTTISIGDQEYTAYQSLLADQLYLVWASKEDGSTGWYWYDPSEETFQRDLGQFSQQGLVNSLQNELTTLKSSSAKSLSQRLFIIVGLGVVCLILLILTIVFAARGKRTDDVYEDEDDDPAIVEPEDEEPDLEEDEPDEEPEEEEYEEEKPKKRKSLFGRKKRGQKEEDEEEDDSPYDELIYEEKEKQDFSLTADLPEIDLSALDEEAEEKVEEVIEEELDEDPEIEILDLDDLNL